MVVKKFLEDYKKLCEAEKLNPELSQDLTCVYFWRPIASFILVFMKDISISPNAITTLSIVPALFAGICFLIHTHAALILGGVLLFSALVLDTLDGQYARLKNKTSIFGHWYDGFAESIRYTSIFFCLAVGFYYNNDFTTQFFLGKMNIVMNHTEWILIMAAWILAHHQMFIYIQITRRSLPQNYGTLVNLNVGKTKKYYFSFQVISYFLIILFLCLNQVYLLYLLFSTFMPVCWIYPFMKLYKNRGAKVPQLNKS